MVDLERIFEEEFSGNEEALHIVIEHSQAVAEMAREIAERVGGADVEFVEEAAMLHDVGVVYCNAPGLGCHGSEPYIRHGLCGGAALRRRGLEAHARVCERHTGAGLSQADIERQGLPLPHRDFLPETLEERIICYADKFYSKSGNLRERKPLDVVKRQMLAHGEDTFLRFMSMHREFGEM